MSVAAAPAHQQARSTTLLLLAALCAVNFLGWRNVTAHPAPQLTREHASLRLDPNVASQHELEILPAVGPALAANIVAYRASREAPAFRCLEDLDAVERIGPVTLERLRPYLRFPSSEKPGNG